MAKFHIFVQSNRYKFGQDSKLAEFLIGTANKTLVEASPCDRIWGIGLAEDAEGIEDETNWKGENLLGKALMVVREELLKDLEG